VDTCQKKKERKISPIKKNARHAASVAIGEKTND